MLDLQVKRIAYALGASVTGVDLRGPLDAATVSRLRSLWLEHQLLCFPGQDLDKMQFIGFAKHFGDLEMIRKENRDSETPHIGYLTNQPRDGKPWNGFKGGTNWHSDENYTIQPTAATFVLAKLLPPVGGDTMFANQYMAYETLSPTLQKILEGLEVVQVLPERAAPPAPGETPTAQPAVRIHPETGRKALFLGARAKCFVGMTEEESKPLLDYLNEHAVRYEFTYRHRWTPNDLVMWDNRCLLHIALRDYDERREPRHMFRTATLGEHSGRSYTGEVRALAGAATAGAAMAGAVMAGAVMAGAVMAGAVM